MNLVGMIIWGSLGLYNFFHGDKLWAFLCIIMAGLYFFERKIEKIIENISNLDFEPIQIDIKPKWENLFKDYKLVDSAWNVDRVWDKIKQEKYHILKNGVRFTLLKPNLIYWNDFNVFRGEVDFRLRIEELNPALSNFVGFRVRWGVEGFEIHLTTPESRQKSPSYHLGHSPDEIKIATIPYSELRMYKYKNVKKEIRDQILKKVEWTRQEPDAEYSSIDTTCTLEHKYFTVYYNHV